MATVDETLAVEFERMTLPPVEGIDPEWQVNCFSEIDVEDLVRANISRAWLDIDGCLTPAYHHDQLDPLALKKIAEIADAGIALDIASNNQWNLSPVHTLIDAIGLVQPYFDADGEPVFKPHQTFFERGFSLCGNPDPSTILMIGDTPEHDVLGAQSMGMKAMLVGRVDPYGFFELDHDGQVQYEQERRALVGAEIVTV